VSIVGDQEQIGKMPFTAAFKDSPKDGKAVIIFAKDNGDRDQV
jgi:hypothetical protein